MLYLTGSTSGIGKACKNLASNRDTRYVALSHSDDTIEQAKKGRYCAGAYKLDFHSVTNLARQLAEVFSEQETPTALVHCAGKLSMKSASASDESDWDEIFDINAKTGHFLVREFAEKMSAHDGGSIVVIASVAGVAGLPNQSIYSASKAALIASSKSMAKEYFHRGVRIFTISPGPVSTDLFSDCLEWSARDAGKDSEEVLDNWLSSSITRKPASAISVAETVFDAIDRWPDEMVGCNLVLASGHN